MIALSRLLPLLLVACASAPMSRTGELLAEMAPAPFAIAVVPVTGQIDPSSGDAIRFAIPASELQGRLVDELRALNASTRVFPANSIEAARGDGADLVLRARLSSAPGVEHVSNSGWFVSGALWLLTWIGGLIVEDATYDARLELECEYLNPYYLDADPIVETQRSEPVDLTYFDRNDAISGMTLLTFILPPFWTGDDEAITSESVSQVALSQVSASITDFIKSALDERVSAEQGDVSVEVEAAGGGKLRLSGAITAHEPIVGIEVTVDGEVVAGARHQGARLPREWIGRPQPFDQQSKVLAMLRVKRLQRLRDDFEQRYRLPWQTAALELDPGSHTVRVRARLESADGTRQWDSSRTVSVGPR